jgi:hypothetical protein
MTPTHAVKKGRSYRCYVSTSLITGARSDHAKGWRIPAGDVECLVPPSLRSALSKAMQLAEVWATLPPIRIREIVRSVIGTVEIHDEKVIASLKRKEIASALLGDTFIPLAISGPETIELHIGAKLRRAGKGIRLVIGGGIVEARWADNGFDPRHVGR